MTKYQSTFCVWILFITLFTTQVNCCGYPGSPAHAFISFSTEAVGAGTVATYKCDRGFELLGPARRVCAQNGTWSPPGMPFCVLNVAIGKAPMQSSVAQGGYPQKAIDGKSSNTPNPETCTMTEIERPPRTPWWYVNLLEAYMVQLVRIDFGRPCCANNVPATITVRVGNSRPDSGSNPICNRYIGPIEMGRPLFLPCSPPMPGAFVSVHWEGPPGTPLSICEAFVYTDQAVPVESCPSFRDQPLGGTATFNGKCYIFYNNQPTNFAGASRTCESRGGTLVDETSLILQGFLSWELWQRHRNEPSGQYWMGAIRDPANPNNWKWLSGNEVSTSFWNLPGGNENCSRFDGTKGWLWSDTNCNLNLNFICQHKPLTCGHPEQPPNSTLAVLSRNFVPGNSVRYICNPGDLLIGPEKRICQASGYYNEYAPTCKHLECGLPAEIPNGQYQLVNGTKFYMSMVRYSCNENFWLVGRGDLICDVDEKWDGPPPRCEPSTCPPPIPIANGYFATSTNVTVIGTVLTYFCSETNYALVGQQKIVCTESGTWSNEPPVCQKSTQPGGGQIGHGSPQGFALASSSATPLLPENVPSKPTDNEMVNSENPSLLPSLLDWLSPSKETLPQAQSTPPTSVFSVTERNGFEPIDPMRTSLSLDLLKPTSESDSASTEENTRISFEITDTPEEVVHTGPSEDSTITSQSTTTIRTSIPNTTTTITSTTTRQTTTTTTPTTTTKTTPTTSTTTPATTTTTPTTTTTTPSTTTPSTTTTTTQSTTTSLPKTTTIKPKSPVLSHNVHHSMPSGVTLHPNIITSRTNIHSTQKDITIISVTQSTTKTKTEKELATANLSNSAAGRLNTGGIIALSVFGGFVILAAVITILVIVYRRKRTPRGSMDSITVSTYDSGSEHGGLTKYYKRAWDNLRIDKGNVGLNSQRKEVDNYRHTGTGRNFEGLRDSNEMTVSDSAAWNMRKEADRQKHHHQHHHHRHQQRGGSPENVDYGPWFTRTHH